MFKAKQVDAAVTWEPDLSGAVDGARRRGARARLDDGGDQHHRRHARARGRTSSTRRPRRVRDFVHGWFDGIEMMKADPAGVVRRRRQGAQARHRDGVGHALGPEAHALRRQRAVLRPDRRQGALRDAVRHGVRHLAQEGARDARRSTRRTGPTRASSRRWRRPTRARRCEEPKLAAKAAVREGPRDHQQADPDPLHAGLGRDHAGLVLRARRARRDDDVVRQHVPARRGQHRLDRARRRRT